MCNPLGIYDRILFPQTTESKTAQYSYLAHRPYLIQPVKSTAPGGAEGGGDEEWVETILYVFHHCLLQPGTSQHTMVIRFKDPQLHKSNHCCLFHARVSLLRWNQFTVYYGKAIIFINIPLCTSFCCQDNGSQEKGNIIRQTSSVFLGW